jgi:hypothetical protein
MEKNFESVWIKDPFLPQFFSFIKAHFDEELLLAHSA